MRALPSTAGTAAVLVAVAAATTTDGETPREVHAGTTRPTAVAWSPSDWHTARTPWASEAPRNRPPASLLPSREARADRSESRRQPDEVVSVQATRGDDLEAAPPPTREPRTTGGPDSSGQATAGREPREPQPALTPAEIARAVGAAEADVARQWPVLEDALREKGMTDVRSQVAALATIVTEVGTALRPINEYGGPGYFTQMYEGRSDLGNTRSGDGARFHGRGYIQLTGRANYRSYGERLGLPLEDRPELALRPEVGARVLVEYFEQRQIDDDARRGRWRMVRLKVNGGYNGWSTYRQLVSSLLRVASR